MITHHILTEYKNFVNIKTNFKANLHFKKSHVIFLMNNSFEIKQVGEWNMKSLPKSFFEKTRPNVRENKNIAQQTDNIVIPIEWSKEVLEGKKKVLIKLPKNN